MHDILILTHDILKETFSLQIWELKLAPAAVFFNSLI